MKSKQAWSDEEALRRLKGLPSAETETSAEKFFSSISSSQNSITDEEALEILQGRKPEKALRESTSQRSAKPASGPLAQKIEAITEQIEGALETSRREEIMLEVIRAGRDGRSG